MNNNDYLHSLNYKSCIKFFFSALILSDHYSRM
jgi:hypothetical protein